MRFHFSPLPCSDLGQGLAMIITAFMLDRFFCDIFAQTHTFFVSLSSFSPLADMVIIIIIIS